MIGLRIIIWTIFFSCLSSCVSTYTALQNLPLSSDKATVRTILGKPSSVGRTDGRDQWTYKFKWQAQEYTRNVFFEDGLVHKIGPLTPYPNYEKKMLESESLDDYETNAMLYYQQKERGFRKINSLNKSQNNKNPQNQSKK